MLIILGDSASGKTTIAKTLMDTLKLKKIVTFTTREPRQNETDGIDYHFVTKDRFMELKLENFFAEVGCYRGWWYGTPTNECTNDKILVVTPAGLRQLNKHTEIEITSFYIKVDRRSRLVKMLQRGDDIDECCRRSLSDVGMFDWIENEVDYVIDNENYNKSPLEISSIISILANLKEDKN